MAQIRPVKPPIVNTKMKPTANNIGVSKVIEPFHMVAIQLNTFTPVGTAITIVAATKFVLCRRDWFKRYEERLLADYKDNVWISSAGGPRLRERTENMILKFTRDGKFLFQVGKRGASKGSLDTQNFNNAADIYVYPKTNEAFIADGYVNRRVVVLDAETGKFKRMWGAYGNVPDDKAPNGPLYDGPGAQQFNLVHGVRVSNGGLVYVAERRNNRVQVFTIDGKFQREIFVERKTKLLGTAFSGPALDSILAESFGRDTADTARFRESVARLRAEGFRPDVIDAHLAGLEDRHAAGKPLAHVASVASFFVSRVDTEIDRSGRSVDRSFTFPS